MTPSLEIGVLIEATVAVAILLSTAAIDELVAVRPVVLAVATVNVAELYGVRYAACHGQDCGEAIDGQHGFLEAGYEDGHEAHEAGEDTEGADEGCIAAGSWSGAEVLPVNGYD